MSLPDEYRDEISRDSVLYIVDCSVSMTQNDALVVALNSAIFAIRDAARQGNAQLDTGVIIYNALTTNASESRGMAHVLLSLKEPSVEALKSLIRWTENMEAFSQRFKSIDAKIDGLLAALRLASSELSQLHTRSFRRIVLITDEDDPASVEGDFQTSKAIIAANLASDLTASPAFIMPIFLNRKKDNATNSIKFDVQKFWSKLSYTPPPSSLFTSHHLDSFTTSNHLEPWELDSLANPKHALILSKSRRKRPVFKGVLSIGSLSLGIKGYHIVHAQTNPTPVKVAHVTDKESRIFRELLLSQRTLAFADSGNELNYTDSQENQRAFKLSTSKNESEWIVPVNSDQLKSLASAQELSDSTMNDAEISQGPTMSHLKIDRFVDFGLADIGNYGTTSQAMYISPSSDYLAHSWKAFATLKRSMQRRNVVAVAFYQRITLNKVAIPEQGYLYAFDPCSYGPESREADSDKNKDPENQSPFKRPSLNPDTRGGMYFVPVPFKEDIRSSPSGNDIVECTKVSVLSTLIKHLLRKFLIPTGFNPQRFPKYSARQFAEILEHHALDLALDDKRLEQKDETIPRYDRISKSAKAISEKLSTVLLSESENTTFKDSSPIKRRKLTTSDEVNQAYASGQLSSFTVAQLRDIIGPLESIPVRASKAHLILLLENSLRNSKQPDVS